MTRSTYARSQGDRGVERTSLDPHGFHVSAELTAKDAVAVTKQILRDLVEGKSFPQLLGSPFGGGMGGDVEVDDAAPVVSQHQKYVQHSEADRRHREE